MEKEKEFYLSNLESLLCGILDCNAAELELFSKTRYDLAEVAKRVIDEGMKPSIDSLISMVITWGIYDLETAIEKKMSDIAKKMSEAKRGEYSPLCNQYTEVFKLDPEEDVEFEVNSINVTLCFKYNEDIYKKYLKEEVSEIEKQMGFSFY